MNSLKNPHLMWPSGTFHVPYKYKWSRFDQRKPNFDPDLSQRRTHFRRLFDLAVLLLQRGDTVRARRAWGILCRCYEADSFWDCGLALEIVDEDERASKRRRTSRNIGTGGNAETLRDRIKDPLVRLREQTLARIDRGEYEDALDNLELSLTSQPFQSDALLNFYAALCILFLAQPGHVPTSEDGDGGTQSHQKPPIDLSTSPLRKTWRDRASPVRLKEAIAYLRSSLENLGGIPGTPGALQRELATLRMRRAPNRSAKGQRTRLAKAKQRILEPYGDEIDPHLRLAVLDAYAMMTIIETVESDEDEDDEIEVPQPVRKRPPPATNAPPASGESSDEDEGEGNATSMGFSIFGVQDSPEEEDSG